SGTWERRAAGWPSTTASPRSRWGSTSPTSTPRPACPRPGPNSCSPTANSKTASPRAACRTPRTSFARSNGTWARARGAGDGSMQVTAPAPVRHGTQLALTILAVVLSVGAYVLVTLGKTGKTPTDIGVFIAILGL